MRTALLLTLALAQLDVVREPDAAGEINSSLTGEPLRKAFVTVQRRAPGAVATMETTNPEGKFRFDGLSPGDYTLRVERAGFATRRLNVTLPDRQLKLKLDPLAAIHGRVTDDDGDPLPGVRVRVLRAENVFGTTFFALIATVNAAPDGAYRADELTPGRYYLHADSGASTTNDNVRRVVRPAFYPGVATPGQALPLEANAGAILRDIDIRLPWKPAYTVRGRLEYAGAAKSEIRLYPDLGPFVMEWNHRSVPITGQTFEVKNVPEGEYVLRALAGSDNEQQTRLPLALSADVDGLRLKPETVPAVQVRVDKARDCDTPVWILFPRQAGQTPVGLAERKLARVLPGDYRVVTSEAGNCYASSLEFNGQPVTREITVAGDGVWHARVASDGGDLEGRLVVKDKLAAGAVAILLPDQPEARLPLYQTAAADSQGRFVFENLAPGKYRLLAKPTLQEPSDLDVLDQWRARGRLVMVEKEKRTYSIEAVE